MNGILTFTARAWGLAVIILGPLCVVERLQAQDPGDIRLSFEVASIRENISESAAGGVNASGGAAIAVRGKRLTAVNAALRDIIRYAYQLETFQAIEGGPRWLDDRFDITAAIPESVSAADAPRLMLRTLLADRFKLSVRPATRDQSVYGLVVARRDGRLGPGLKPSTMDCEAWRRQRQNETPANRLAALRESAQSGKITCDMAVWPNVARIAANGITMGDFGRALSRQQAVGGPVVDRTGLNSAFDFDLRFAARAPGAPADASAREPGTPPSLFVALEEQLGLRLERTRGPVDVLLIERIEPLSKE